MSYRFLEGETMADVAFEAEGATLERTFSEAADGVLNTMVDDPSSVRPIELRRIELICDDPESLLFEFLQEFIYFKDFEGLLLRAGDIQFDRQGERHRLKAEAFGEYLDPTRHEQRADVKAVTFHRFKLQRTRRGWKCFVILDV